MMYTVTDKNVPILNFVLQVLSLVENLCNAEQDFCAQFFFLDVDVKVFVFLKYFHVMYLPILDKDRL